MENLEKQLKNASNIRMTESERSFMRSNIISFMNIHDMRKGSYVKSPYHHFWNPLLVTLCSVMFIIASGSTISYNAEDSLPGDKLYNFKIKVNEEVQGILITSPTEKILWQQNRVAKRIEEVKQLAASGELTEETASIAERAIEEHIAKVDEDVQNLAKQNPNELSKTTEVLNTIIAGHDKDLKELVQIEDIKTETKDNISKIENPDKEPSLKITEVVETQEQDTKKDEIVNKEIIEPVLEKSVSSNAVTSIIAKIQKESESIQEISKPNTNNTTILETKDTIKTPAPTPVKATQ